MFKKLFLFYQVANISSDEKVMPEISKLIDIEREDRPPCANSLLSPSIFKEIRKYWNQKEDIKNEDEQTNKNMEF
jgi:hypothetical protein